MKAERDAYRYLKDKFVLSTVEKGDINRLIIKLVNFPVEHLREVFDKCDVLANRIRELRLPYEFPCELLDRILRFDQLESLTADNVRELRNHHLQVLNQLPNLTELAISYTAIDDHGLQHLADMGLTDVNLEQTHVTGSGLTELPNTINSLRLSKCPIEPVHASHLLHLRELQALFVADTRVDGEAVKTLSQLPKLELLDVRDTNLSAGDLASLSHHSSLKYLYVTEGQEVSLPGIEVLN